MAKFNRNTAPKKVVWYQPFNMKQQQFYWLADAIVQDQKLARKVVASIDMQTIHLTSDNVSQVTVRLRDDLVDLEKPVTVKWNGKVVFEGMVERNIKTISKTLKERHDVGLSYDAEIVVK
jgi:hypothetical protein